MFYLIREAGDKNSRQENMRSEFKDSVQLGKL